MGFNVAISTIFVKQIQCEVFCMVHSVASFVVLSTLHYFAVEQIKKAKSCKCMQMHNCRKNCVCNGHARQAGQMQTGFHTSQAIHNYGHNISSCFAFILVVALIAYFQSFFPALGQYDLHFLFGLLRLASNTWLVLFSFCRTLSLSLSPSHQNATVESTDCWHSLL